MLAQEVWTRGVAPPLTIVILVLHGFFGLGFNEELAREANLLLVVDHHLEEGSHVVQLPLQVCVQQSLVAFTTTPKHYNKGKEKKVPNMARCSKVFYLRGWCSA